MKTSIKTLEVKKELLNLLQNPLLPTDPTRIRLRERSGDDKLTTVYHDNRELSRYNMYNEKEIAIQIIPE